MVTPVNLLLLYAFDRGTFSVFLLTYFYISKSARAYFFPNLSQFITFAAAPLVLTPFVRNQDATQQLPSRGSKKFEGSGDLPRESSVFLREDLCAGYGVRFSTKTCWKLVLFLQKSLKISGNLREFMGECNLGILYSSSLLILGKCFAGRFQEVRLLEPCSDERL